MTRFIKLVTRPTLYGLLSILFLWQVLSLCVNSNVIPAPLEAITKFFVLLPTELWRHLITSLYRMLLALVISLMIAVPLGILCGLYTLPDRLLSPITYILYPLPKVAFLPIFMISLGKLSILIIGSLYILISTNLILLYSSIKYLYFFIIVSSNPIKAVIKHTKILLIYGIPYKQTIRRIYSFYLKKFIGFTLENSTINASKEFIDRTLKC